MQNQREKIGLQRKIENLIRVINERHPEYIVIIVEETNRKEKGSLIRLDITHKLSTSSPATGGIDFNPNNLNIETQGKGMDYNAPIDPQLLESLTSSPIEGFSPVIFNITPITNLPGLLGLNDQNDEPLQQSKSSNLYGNAQKPALPIGR